MTWRGVGGAVLVAFSLGLAAGEARAQEACAIPGDVSEDVYNAFFEMLNQGFPMPIPACERLTQAALSACHKAVSASARCWKSVGKALAKGAKLTCNEQGEEEEACLIGTGLELQELATMVEGSEADGHAACEADVMALQIACFGI